jgi:hypothetical protein
VDAPPAQVVSPLLSLLAQQGLLGAVVFVFGWIAWSKDKELTAEREARIQDAKNYTDLALKLQQQVLDNVNKMNDTVEEIRKMTSQGRAFGSNR